LELIFNRELSPLETLPSEIMMHIFRYLDIQELGRLSQVSKTIATYSNDEKLWERLVTERWGPLRDQMLYKDVITGTQILWKVTYKKRSQTEKLMEIKKKNLSKLTYLDCKYCHGKAIKQTYQRNIFINQFAYCPNCSHQWGLDESTW
jgi:hypothetical protein